MPVTPYHLGPGLLIKAAAPRHVSFAAFVVANVVIDLESVVNLVLGRHPVHVALHTLPGALIVGVLSGAAVAAASRARRAPAGLGPALAGGFLGGLGQTALDAVAHRDLLPLAPFSDTNPLLHVVSLEAVHTACAVAGVLGAVVLGVRRHRADLEDAGR